MIRGAAFPSEDTMSMKNAIVAAFLLTVSAAPAAAQLTAAKEGPIVYGHHHFNVTSVDEHRKFWTTLGGTAVKVGADGREIIRFPNVLVFLTARAPKGGTKGTTVNHVGFGVPNIRQAVDNVKAAGYPIVTRAELPESQPVKDDLAYIENQKTSVAFVMGPDDTKVELVENKALTAPSALHHLHFATHQVDDMKAWYVKVFGARPGMRGSFQAADLPGVNLTFSPSPEAPAGTQGRSLDHIGFEVKGLEAFCRQLEAMGVKLERPFTPVASLNIHIAFIRDPWGTYIELTEGLDKVQ
jgi:catechol 2,3-dioxygenase-like lactoylglutathione lyase family enzyme